MKHLILYVFLLFTAIPECVYSQVKECYFTLKGAIVDLHTREPLAFATVYVQESGKGTIASEEGQFEMKSLCPGDIHIVISHVGCESKVVFLPLKSDTLIDFTLNHSATQLEVVHIQANPTDSRLGTSRQIISKEQMLEQSGSTLSELTSKIAGVRILRSGPGLGKPVIQGMTGNRIGIIQYGLALESQQWGNDHAPEVDAEAGDKILVFKGAESVRYGVSAMGGIISVEPSWDSPDPHWHGSVKTIFQTNGRKAGGQAIFRKNGTTSRWRVAASGNLSGDMQTPGYFLTNTGQKQVAASVYYANSQTSPHPLNLYYSYFHSSQGMLKGAHPGSLADLEKAFTLQVPLFTRDSFSYKIEAPRQLVAHHMVSGEKKFLLKEDYFLRMKAGFQANLREEFDVRRSGRESKPSLDLALLSQFYELSLHLTNPVRDIHGQLGFQYKNANNTNQPGTGVRPLIPDYLQHQGAFFGLIQWQKENWSAECGLRSEWKWNTVYFIQSNQTVEKISQHFQGYAFNAGVQKNLARTRKWKSDFSFTQRPPDVNEQFSQGLHQGVSGIEEGNRSLQPERAYRISTEWTGEVRSGFQVQATAHYQYIEQYIYLRPDGTYRLTVRGAFPVFRYSGDDVSLAGLTAKANLRIGNDWVIGQQADYIYARNHSSETGLIRIPPLMYTGSIQYNRDRLNWVNEFKAMLEITAIGRQVLEASAGDFLPPPSGYFLVNGLLRMKWKQKNGHDLQLLIRGENLLNLTYRDYMNRLRYFADEPGRNLTMTFQILI